MSGRRRTIATFGGCVLATLAMAEADVALGAFLYEGDAKFPAGGAKGIDAFEDLTGAELGSVMWYTTWDDPFPTKEAEIVRRHGAIPHVTWELFWPSENPDNARPIDDPAGTGLDAVLAGEHDEYIDRFAEQGAKWGGEVLIRFLHEFNGDWYTWGGKKNGGPEKVRAVWRYVVERCRARGARNFKWIWCPHGASTSVSTEAWNKLEAYWPGDRYVDWIGIDGYNWYPKDPWGGERPLRDFDSMFKDTYAACTKLSRKPVMICEIGSGEFEHDDTDKARWVTQVYETLGDYPMIKMMVWFHIKKERDWRINSSPEALAAFQAAVGSKRRARGTR